MNYFDTDTTQTGWNNFSKPNDLDYCPTPGVSRTPDNVEIEYSSATSIGSHMEIERQSTSKLGAMFNKFLYQK